MKDLHSLSEIPDESLILNKATMAVLVRKLESLSDENEFKRMIITAFNTLVTHLDVDSMPLSAGMHINLLAFALDNKLDVVKMISDATTMRDSFAKEMERRINATS